jgi:NAD(P)-dependent dehydrogenase (short-subunit alcohol dehydrogenase family)
MIEMPGFRWRVVLAGAPRPLFCFWLTTGIWLDMTPMGRLGERFEIAPAVVYLASKASTYVTGAIFVDRWRLHSVVKATGTVATTLPLKQLMPQAVAAIKPVLLF